MNGYNLIRRWYDFKFENPSKAKAIHSDMYCYIVDLWNRLGQKKEFGLPTSVTMELLGIGSYNTFKKTLDDLIEFGFIKIVSESKNQHQSKIVAISKIDKATDKALDKATARATDKASDKATDTIDKQLNNETIKQINNNSSLSEIKISDHTPRKRFAPPNLEEVKDYCFERNNQVDAQRFIDYYTSNGWMVGKNKMKDWKSAVRTWEKNNYSINTGNNGNKQQSTVRTGDDQLADFIRRGLEAERNLPTI